MSIAAMQRMRAQNAELEEIRGQVAALTDACRYILEEVRKINAAIEKGENGGKDKKTK